MKQSIQSTIGAAGDLGIQVIRPGAPRPEQKFWPVVKHALPARGLSREVNSYRLRNFHNVWRGLWRVFIARILGLPHAYGVLYATVIRKNGERVNLGCIGFRVVTTTGVGFIVDAFQNSVELENMKYHAYGTGSNAEATGNTALHTELTTEYATNNTRPTGSTTEGASANIYRTVGTLSPDATVAITEHGIFDQASNAGGVLLDKTLFTAINLVLGDSLQTTYDMTYTAGS